MNGSGIHYYEPPKNDLVFLNTVSKNKEGFIKRQIKSDVKAQELHPTLEFSTAKEVKCIITSNHIQDCPVETKDMDNAKAVHGKYMPYLKGKTNRTKPIRVTKDLIRVPK